MIHTFCMTCIADIMPLHTSGLAVFFLMTNGAFHRRILLQICQRCAADQTFFTHVILITSLLCQQRAASSYIMTLFFSPLPLSNDQLINVCTIISLSHTVCYFFYVLCIFIYFFFISSFLHSSRISLFFLPGRNILRAHIPAGSLPPVRTCRFRDSGSGRLHGRLPHRR